MFPPLLPSNRLLILKDGKGVINLQNVGLVQQTGEPQQLGTLLGDEPPNALYTRTYQNTTADYRAHASPNGSNRPKRLAICIYRIFFHVATAVGVRVHRLSAMSCCIAQNTSSRERTSSEHLRAILTHVASAQAAARWFVRYGSWTSLRWPTKSSLRTSQNIAPFQASA
jgi:hypothetical protein